MLTHCPWSSMRPDPLQFCEQVLCSWIQQPSNTFSNLGFFLVGWLIWRMASREGRPRLRAIAFACLLTGLGSTFYHASGTRLGGLCDYLGMFSATALMTGLNVRRWLGWDWTRVYSVFVLTALSLFLPTVFWPGSERLVFIFGGPCCLIEARLFLRDQRHIRYRFYGYSLAVTAAGTLFWWLDNSRMLCVPANHLLTGHAVWHLLMAVSYYFVYRYYSQFASLTG